MNGSRINLLCPAVLSALVYFTLETSVKTKQLRQPMVGGYEGCASWPCLALVVPPTTTTTTNWHVNEATYKPTLSPLWASLRSCKLCWPLGLAGHLSHHQVLTALFLGGPTSSQSAAGFNSRQHGPHPQQHKRDGSRWWLHRDQVRQKGKERPCASD